MNTSRPLDLPSSRLPAGKEPLVSCLMVTRNRVKLAQRAVQCFMDQTWSHKQLVIVDDGEESYAPLVGACRARGFDVLYHRVPTEPRLTLGALRNVAIEQSDGAFLAQWDDDEWYAPERLTMQLQALISEGTRACVLKWTLMHLDTPAFTHHPYRADVGRGTPGTIVHQRSEIRYPALRIAEDSVFLDAHRPLGVSILGREASHLFIRCFHGSNTWDANHFLRRLRRTPRDMFHFGLARLRGDILRHPAFALEAREASAVSRFREDSAAVGLLRSGA